MFGEEARIPCEIVSRRPHFEDTRTPASFALKLIQTLEAAFEFARENLHTAQKRMNESYDIGVNKRIFKSEDNVYNKIKNPNALYASKLQSRWSVPHEEIARKGVVVTLRNWSNNSIIKMHADRLSYPWIALRASRKYQLTTYHLLILLWFLLHLSLTPIILNNLVNLVENLFLKASTILRIEKQGNEN